MSMNKGAKVYRLNFKKKNILYNWVNQKKEHIQETRPTYEDMATLAEKELGFQVTVPVIKGLVKEAIDWVWPPPRKKNPQGGLRTVKYGELCTKLAELEARVTELEDFHTSQ